jgi:hypothetical protein
VPQLQWKTWVRLAFVEAGSDWRSLNKLAVEDGVLRDYLLVPEMHNGGYGVRGWEESTGVVASESRPSNGAFSVADPRSPVGAAEYQQYGVLPWKRSAGAVINVKSPGQGTYSVADPRHGGPAKHSNEFRIVRWGSHSMAVTGALVILETLPGDTQAFSFSFASGLRTNTKRAGCELNAVGPQRSSAYSCSSVSSGTGSPVNRG